MYYAAGADGKLLHIDRSYAILVCMFVEVRCSPSLASTINILHKPSTFITKSQLSNNKSYND